MKSDPAVMTAWRRYKSNPANMIARNVLVAFYLPIVERAARKMQVKLPASIEVDDLISSGVFGLMDAIKGFDLSRKLKFETYCALRIRGAMLDHLRELDFVPRVIRTKERKLKGAAQSLGAKLGRTPTDAEIAEHLDISEAEVERMITETMAVRLMSLQSKIWDAAHDTKEVRIVERLVDAKSSDPTATASAADRLRFVTRSMSGIERLIIVMYYWEQITMKEIGLSLNLSEGRISQLHSQILARLRSRLADRREEVQP
jgi:RNA polymerase sigma factor for flagellar operon FliA